jgi:hypothetical protein
MLLAAVMAVEEEEVMVTVVATAPAKAVAVGVERTIEVVGSLPPSPLG